MFGKSSGGSNNGSGGRSSSKESPSSGRGVKDGVQFTADDGTKHTINSV